MRARRDADLARDRADLLRPAPVGAPLVDRDLRADELLVDRLGGLLHELLRHAVLDDRLAPPGGRADREGQLDRLDDPVEEQRALGRLELLRVVLGVRQGAELVLELLAHRLLDDLQPLALEDQVEARADLHLADDVARGLHRQRRSELVLDLVDGAGRLAQADGPDRVADPPAPGLGELVRHRHVEPLRLAGLLAELLLRLAELADLLVRELERLEERLLRDHVRPGLDHRERVLRADDDQVEIGALRVLCLG